MLFGEAAARVSDDAILWLLKAILKAGGKKGLWKRLLEESAKIEVALNVEETRCVDLTHGESITSNGFEIRRYQTRQARWGVLKVPLMKARTKLLRRLNEDFQRFHSQPMERVIARINPMLRGWVHYIRIGRSSHCFGFVCTWV